MTNFFEKFAEDVVTQALAEVGQPERLARDYALGPVATEDDDQ